MTIVCSPKESKKVAFSSRQKKDALEVRFVAVDELSEFDTPASVYFQRSYLKSVSANDTDGLRHIFPVVYFNGSLIAYGAFCLLRREKTQFVQRVLEQGNTGRFWNQTLSSVLPLFLGTCDSEMQILIAGNMLVSGPFGLHFCSPFDAAFQTRVWAAVLKSVENEFGSLSLTVLKDFCNSPDTVSCPSLPGFFNVSTLPLMQISLNPNWRGFSDYLNAMAAKYRIRARAALNKASSLSTEYWDAKQIRSNMDAIQSLYLEVYQRAKFRIQPVSPEYIPSLANEMGNEAFRFIAWKDGDKLIGFSTAFFYSNRLDAHLIGLDYSYNKSHSLYLNMIYRYIQDALELGADLVDFGRTAMEIKSTAGAVPQDLGVLIRLHSKLGNKLAAHISSKMQAEPWIQRHPFKTTA